MKSVLSIKTDSGLYIKKDDFITIVVGRFFKKSYRGRIKSIQSILMSNEFQIELDMSEELESNVETFYSNSIACIEYKGVNYKNNYSFIPFIVNSKGEEAFIGEKIILKQDEEHIICKFSDYNVFTISFDASVIYNSKVMTFLYEHIDELDFDLP